VERGDRGLDLVRASAAQDQRAVEQGHALDDRGTIPEAAILIL